LIAVELRIAVQMRMKSFHEIATDSNEEGKRDASRITLAGYTGRALARRAENARYLFQLTGVSAVHPPGCAAP